MLSRSVRDVIRNQQILTMPPEATVHAAAQAMARARVGSVMVERRHKLVGIFTERDALVRVLAAGLDPNKTTLASVMTKAVTTVTMEKKVGYALHLMHDNGFRHVPVVEDGRPVGMISIRDALGSELARFEEELQMKQELLEGMR
jgi:CBS domain-containing protein